MRERTTPQVPPLAISGAVLEFVAYKRWTWSARLWSCSASLELHSSVQNSEVFGFRIVVEGGGQDLSRCNANLLIFPLFFSFSIVCLIIETTISV